MTISEEVGISRDTAQRYLASLAQSGRVLSHPAPTAGREAIGRTERAP